jgi:hypothetical protein
MLVAVRRPALLPGSSLHRWLLAVAVVVATTTLVSLPAACVDAVPKRTVLVPVVVVVVGVLVPCS